MHDDLLERRLRAVLHAEGDGLPFTITADELRRRLAARRRSRIGRSPQLLLAAAIGVGLLGAGAAIGSWVSRIQPGPNPAPSGPAVAPSPNRSSGPQASGSASSAPAPTLPDLAAFLRGTDPGEIVRAQAIGPAAAPTAWSHGITGPGSTAFAEVDTTGTYRIVVACLGAPEVSVSALHADRLNGPGAMRFVCDGASVEKLVELHAGDHIVIGATDPTSWRVALLAPGRAAPHAAAIAADVTKAAGPRLDNSPIGGALTTPDYSAVGPRDEPTLVSYVNARDAYRIATSCAGPGPLTFVLRAPFGISPPNGDGAALSEVATIVACDGGVHLDVIRFPFAIGADVWIDAPNGTAWRFAAAWEDPPIQALKDGDGWKQGFGLGRDLRLDSETNQSTLTFQTPVRARIVVTCRGGTGVDILAHDRDSGHDTPFSAPCQVGETIVSVGPEFDSVRSIDLTVSNHGAMWLLVSVQQSSGP